MPRPSLPPKDPLKSSVDTVTPTNQTVEEKLDVIVRYLERMDRRDHWRTIGGSIKGLLALIPLIFLLASAYYFYKYGDELISKIISETAKQTMQMDQGSLDELMKQFGDFQVR